MTTPAKTVRTRFAPSPTGFIHLGNIRSALYPWAYARSTGGSFILRIEDTDEERSSQAAVDVILEGLRWLGLDADEGPFFQMQRMPRYREVVQTLLDQGLAYPCYMSVAELDALRERQIQAKEKPRYDGTWRPEPGKTLPTPPQGVQPVIRFKTPTQGVVAWDDKVKGRVEFRNDELDDLVIARPAPAGAQSLVGTPTYNFCVVVDDMDMRITHVIRGDDHVNNTPRQIHILRALGQEPPVYAHLPTVLNEQGEKLSKRHGAKPVTHYRDEGYLPDALVNYLARLGWSHGDDEIFTREQFIAWFDLEHLGRSAAQFDEAKLRWVAQQHMKMASDAQLASSLRAAWPEQTLAAPLQAALGQCEQGLLERLCALYKDRCATLLELAQWLGPHLSDLAQRELPAPEAMPELALASLRTRLGEVVWEAATINQAFKDTLAEHGLKMPQLAVPVRWLVCGRKQTPSIDVVLALMPREVVLQRLKSN